MILSTLISCLWWRWVGIFRTPIRSADLQFEPRVQISQRPPLAYVKTVCCYCHAVSQAHVAAGPHTLHSALSG